MVNKLSIFASVGAISIIGVGVLTFTRPVATAYVAPKATVVAEVIPETPVQPTPVVPVEVVTPVEPVGTTVQVVIMAPVAEKTVQTTKIDFLTADIVTLANATRTEQCMNLMVNGHTFNVNKTPAEWDSYVRYTLIGGGAYPGIYVNSDGQTVCKYTATLKELGY